MDQDRLNKACEGKAHAAGGMNLPDIKALAQSMGHSGVGLRDELLAFVCGQKALAHRAAPKRTGIAPRKVKPAAAGALRAENPYIAHVKAHAGKGLSKEQIVAMYRAAKAAGALPAPVMVPAMKRSTLLGALHSCGGLPQDNCEVAPNCFWQPKAKRCMTRSGADVVKTMDRSSLMKNIQAAHGDKLQNKIAMSGDEALSNYEFFDVYGRQRQQRDQQGGYWW